MPQPQSDFYFPYTQWEDCSNSVLNIGCMVTHISYLMTGRLQTATLAAVPLLVLQSQQQCPQPHEL